MSDYIKMISEERDKKKPTNERLKLEIIKNSKEYNENSLLINMRERLKQHIKEQNEGKLEKLKEIMLKFRFVVKKKNIK